MLQGTLIYGFINSVVLMLVALGFSVTFGISGVANFAYGALYVMAGYLSWLGLHSLGLPYWLAAPGAVAITAGVAAMIYWFILLRVRGLVVSEVIATFGMGLAILELFRYLGFIGFEYTLPPLIDASVMIGDTYVDAQRLCIVGAGILLAAFLWFFTHYTKTGLAFPGHRPGRAHRPDPGHQRRQGCRLVGGLRRGLRRPGRAGHPAPGHHRGQRGLQRAGQRPGGVHRGRPGLHGGHHRGQLSDRLSPKS